MVLTTKKVSVESEALKEIKLSYCPSVCLVGKEEQRQNFRERMAT